MKAHSHLPFLMLVRLAWRNLWRYPRRTIITLSSIALGFGLAVFSIGLGDGSHNSLIRNAIKLGSGHITIQLEGYQQAPANHKFLAQGILAQMQLEQLLPEDVIAPRVSLQVLASTAANSLGTAMISVQGDHDPLVTILKPMLQRGQWLEDDDERGVWIGSGMARRLKLKLGGKLVIMAGTQSGDTQAQLARVRGIYHSGVDEVDNFLVVSHLNLGQKFLVTEGAAESAEPMTSLAIYLTEPSQLMDKQKQIQSVFAGQAIDVLTWQQVMPELVQFIAIDDAGNYVFLLLILVMVTFGIINTVLMSVLERTREFGLLRALGLSRKQLMLLVMVESLLLSLVSLGAGWLVGGGAHLWFSHHGIDMASLMEGGNAMMGTFMDATIFTELSAHRVWQLSAIVFATTLASGLYPAYKAARVTPVEALRT